MTNAAIFENTVALKPLTGKDYREFGFDDAYFHTLLDFMRIDPDKLDWTRFLIGHRNVLIGFFEAQRNQETWVSIDTENKALAHVQSLALNLSNALEALADTGQAAQRVVTEFQPTDVCSFRHGNVTLAGLLSNPEYKPFRQISNLLFDLRVGLERAKIQKPTELAEPAPTGDAKNDAKRQDALKVKDAALATMVEGQKDRFNRLVEGNSLPRNFAVLAFISRFEELWNEFSDLPFTEGRYEPDARGTISRVVDAAEHCLRKLGATNTRSLIVKKVREIREEMYEPMS